MVETRFSLIDLLTAWFFRRDQDIKLASGKTLDTNGGSISTGGGSLALGAGSITLAGTVDGVDVSTLSSNFSSHIANANAHHNRLHDLDSTSDHSGTLSWSKVSKTGSSLGDLATRTHSLLTGVGANDHHNQSHVLATTSALGADHTVSGLTARQVLIATGATTAIFRAIQEADLPSTLATDTEVAALFTTHNSSGDHDGRYYRENEFSSNPGAASLPLKSDSSGLLQIQGLGAGTTAVSNTIASGGSINATTDVRAGRGLVSGSTSVSGATGMVTMKESPFAPSTPTTGYGIVWCNTSGELWFKNDGGTSTKLA